jgi:hypothetical protein
MMPRTGSRRCRAFSRLPRDLPLFPRNPLGDRRIATLGQQKRMRTMARNAQRRPGRGGAAVSFGKCNAAENSSSSAKVNQNLRAHPRFRRLTERLHRLGPRPVGELLLEVANGRDLIAALEDYAQLNAVAVARLGARDWPTSVWRAA